MKIENDFEFYCYLKSNLPGGYSIVALPSAAYYSEWFFEYNIFKDGVLFKQYKGDFRQIKKNSLMMEAKQLMNEITKGREK